MDQRIRMAEISVALVTVIIAAVFALDARRYPPSPFEPVGSGAVPAGVAWVAFGLGGVMLFQAARQWLAERHGGGPDELTLRVLGAFVLTVLYTVILASGLVRYAIATALFFALAVLILAERPRPLVPWAIGLALLLGFGLDFVFRSIFVTNIP